jgi:hypothetical protein
MKMRRLFDYVLDLYGERPIVGQPNLRVVPFPARTSHHALVAFPDVAGGAGRLMSSHDSVLAIDPGPAESGWVLLSVETGLPTDHGIADNGTLIDSMRQDPHAGHIVIEKVESFGMAVGAEVFETVYWSGQFAEAVYPCHVHRLARRAVKLHLCGSMRAKDANIRQALLDRYGGHDAAIGTKGHPGPLHGIKSHEWSALALAVTFADQRASIEAVAG